MSKYNHKFLVLDRQFYSFWPGWEGGNRRQESLDRFYKILYILSFARSEKLPRLAPETVPRIGKPQAQSFDMTFSYRFETVTHLLIRGPAAHLCKCTVIYCNLFIGCKMYKITNIWPCLRAAKLWVWLKSFNAASKALDSRSVHVCFSATSFQSVK